MDNKDTDTKTQAAQAPTAFLVDLVSNRKIPITTPRCRVGRDDLNDIVITGDQSISRFHFIINKEENQYSVQDAKSRHGTFLNGNQITGPEPINDGDVLKIGVSLFWFVIEAPAQGEGDAPTKGEPEKAKIVLNPNEADVPATGATQDINQLDIMDKLTSLTELAEASKDDVKEKNGDDSKIEAKEESKEEVKEETPSKKDKKEKDKKGDKEDKHAAQKSDSKEVEAKDSKDDSGEESKEDSKEDSKDEPKEESKEESKDESKDDKPAEVESKEETEEEEKSDEKSDEKSEEKSEDKAEDKADDKAEDKSEDKAEDKADDKPASDIESKDDKEPEVSVKDLLGPLHDEIAASREKDQELIKEALEQADIKSESKDDEKEPEVAQEKEEVKAEEPELEKPEEQEDEKSEEKKETENEKSEQSEVETTAKEEDSELSEKLSQKETLERFADIIENSDSGKIAEESKSSPADSHIEERVTSDMTVAQETISSTRNGAEEMTIQGPSTVPDWCKRYFADELKGLNKELDELNDQIRKYQDKIKDIEGQASLTKGIRNTLLVSEGDELIDAVKKVLGLIGWKVTQSDEDKNELLLEGDGDKVTIARVIWTNTNAERSHLGQLSISQTRYWCEKGKEPKGVLIVSKTGDKAPTSLAEESDEDFTDFASKKNVCLMSTLQLLSLYREAALKNTKGDELRGAIYDSKGWLKGYKLEPGDATAEEAAGKSLSSLLSS